MEIDKYSRLYLTFSPINTILKLFWYIIDVE